jgi:hypothetical protein
MLQYKTFVCKELSCHSDLINGCEGHVWRSLRNRVLFTTGFANTGDQDRGLFQCYGKPKLNSAEWLLEKMQGSVRAEEAICQVDHVSIKRAGDKNNTLPRHLRELNEEELAELQSNSETACVWEYMTLEESPAVISQEHDPAPASQGLNIHTHTHTHTKPVALWAQEVHPSSDIEGILGSITLVALTPALDDRPGPNKA